MRTLCLIFFALVCSSGSWANLPIKKSEKQLFDLLHPINSFSANFEQLLIDQNGQPLQTLAGIMHGQRPDKFFWSVYESAGQTIVSDGSRIWLYDADLEQVIIEPYNNNFGANPINMLLDDTQKFSQNFQLIEQRILADSTLQFSLKPVTLNSLYTYLDIGFKDGILSTISFQDNLGQTTQLLLKEFKLNPLFKDNFFTFEIPMGVDVVNHAP